MAHAFMRRIRLCGLVLFEAAASGHALAQVPATQVQAAKVPAIQAPATRIIAQADGQALTQQNLDELLALYAWLLESPLGAAEKDALTGVLVDEFRSGPAKAAKNYQALHQQLVAILAATPAQQARRRAETWKGVIGAAPSDPFLARALKILAADPAVLVVTGQGIVTRPQVEALIASDDNVAEAAGLPKASPADRARITREIAAAFPRLDVKQDRYEAVADAEERSLALQAFVESAPKYRALVLADIKAKVHAAGDVAPEARALENNALLISRMQQFVIQQKIIADVAAVYQSRIAAIREASDRFSWHESRAYQHGESKPGPRTGLGPD
jgi:hypothetical protein